MSTAVERDDDAPMATILERVRALRSSAIRAVLCYAVVAGCLLPFQRRLFTFLSAPIVERLPEGTSMIAKAVASPFLAPFKAALLAALFISMPVLLYLAWRAIRPWVKRGDKVAVPFLAASTVLFYMGVAFAYFLIMPIVFGFFVGAAPEGVAVKPDVDAYLSFAMGLMFAFGLAFQIPIVIVIIVWTGIATRKQLAAARPYVLIGAFTLGMFLTPPDMFSQTLLAVPMYLLFEAALFFCARFLPEDKTEHQADDQSAAAPPS